MEKQKSGVSRPKTKLGHKTMNKITEAAEALFTQKGFYETSIADICRAAETAVGTFYIYFKTKTDIYRYMMERYEREIKEGLAVAIDGLTDRAEIEREGIRCFVKYAVRTPNVYNIIWGSLSVDRQLFTNYYTSFAESYAHALRKCGSEIALADTTAVAYILMGMTNFLGLHAIFKSMSDDEIDRIVDETVMPALTHGIFSSRD